MYFEYFESKSNYFLSLRSLPNDFCLAIYMHTYQKVHAAIFAPVFYTHYTPHAAFRARALYAPYPPFGASLSANLPVPLFLYYSHNLE